jgi:hypothetical protein
MAEMGASMGKNLHIMWVRKKTHPPNLSGCAFETIYLMGCV